ncbi:MAG: GAF domain-containing protein [Bacteroidales bacterium]|nr:GAF domain-containing protein [Bacteroidales bacterium]
MKFKLSLYKRLLAVVLLLSLLIVYFSIYLSHQIKEKDILTRVISDNFQPSITYLSDLNEKYQDSKDLLVYWGNAGKSRDADFRNNMEELFQNELNAVIEELSVYSVKWSPEDVGIYKTTSQLIRDSLFYSYLNLISDYRSLQAESDEVPEMSDFINDQSIVFLQSEIEQNLTYLRDKRRLEMNENFRLIEESAIKIRKSIYGFTFLLLLGIFGISFWIFGFIRKFIRKLNAELKLLTQGIIPQEIKNIRDDETGSVFTQMNKLFAYLKNLTQVSQKINKKEFNNNFKPLSDKDELGIALLDLQNNLKKASEEEERRQKEDKERSWTAEGIARINDILRISSDKLEELAYSLIREIATYTSSQVGALYIMNEDENDGKFLEIIAAYAYDRQKFLDKKILVGEGLVGRCVQENETLFLSDLPKDYLSIKSGLGDSQPASILIVPLHLNENVYGVIELASFTMYERYQIQFVETIGENIATSISKVKINLQTASLLEQTRQQAEEMAAQEEEMRQNMEELRSTQELSAVREEKLQQEIIDLQKKNKS